MRKREPKRRQSRKRLTVYWSRCAEGGGRRITGLPFTFGTNASYRPYEAAVREFGEQGVVDLIPLIGYYTTLAMIGGTRPVGYGLIADPQSLIPDPRSLIA